MILQLVAFIPKSPLMPNSNMFLAEQLSDSFLLKLGYSMHLLISDYIFVFWYKQLKGIINFLFI